MNPADPFQFLSDLLGAARDKIGTPQLPDWLGHELRNRLLLTINHVLQQHPDARQRLLAHQDQVLHIQWNIWQSNWKNNWQLRLQVTPAGLFALADNTQREHLRLQVEEPSAAQLARQAVLGQRPQIHISGDTAFADTVNWLADHVRWNGEADLARIVGAGAAQAIARVLRHMRTALQGFIRPAMPTPPHTTPAYTPAHSPAHTPPADNSASTAHNAPPPAGGQPE